MEKEFEVVDAPVRIKPVGPFEFNEREVLGWGTQKSQRGFAITAEGSHAFVQYVRFTEGVPVERRLEIMRQVCELAQARWG